VIEAETGAHIWADRYDGAVEDVFDLQDKLTQNIVGILEPNLRRAEIERAQRKRPESLDAYDLHLRAMPHMESVMPEDAAVCVGYLEQALKLDPNYAIAHAYMAAALEAEFLRGDHEPAKATAAVRHARAALTFGGDDPTALAVASLVILHLGHDFEAASGAIARAIALNPSSAAAHFFGAHIHAHSGDVATAVDLASRALRLSPFDSTSHLALQARGTVRMREGRFDEAASQYSKAVQANPRFSVSYALYTAALAQAGRTEEAKAVAGRLLALQPNFTITSFLAHVLSIMREELIQALSSGLRTAGLPE
jgi:adenylate cyclase